MCLHLTTVIITHEDSTSRSWFLYRVCVCVCEATVQRLKQTASNVLRKSLIIRLGKFGPLDYSQMSPLQIRMLSSNTSFVTVLT